MIDNLKNNKVVWNLKTKNCRTKKSLCITDAHKENEIEVALHKQGTTQT